MESSDRGIQIRRFKGKLLFLSEVTSTCLLPPFSVYEVVFVFFSVGVGLKTKGRVRGVGIFRRRYGGPSTVEGFGN